MKPFNVYLKRMDELLLRDLQASRLLEVAEMSPAIPVREIETELKKLDSDKLEAGDVPEHAKAVVLFARDLAHRPGMDAKNRRAGVHKALIISAKTEKLPEVIHEAEKILQAAARPGAWSRLCAAAKRLVGR